MSPQPSISELGAMYAAAFDEWEASEEGAEWDAVDTTTELS